VNSATQNRLQNRSGVKSELFQELKDQCYPVLKLEDEIQTFAIVGGPKVYLTLVIDAKIKRLTASPIGTKLFAQVGVDAELEVMWQPTRRQLYWRHA
jgi:hypothetical protein